MRYQWGRKDPFTFATSSKLWGDTPWSTGMYPAKIYTIDGVLIYQNNIGGSNKGKQPVGGVISLSTYATSLMETIKNPVVSYGGDPSIVINQVGHTQDLWDYYWTSYSRGVDGDTNAKNWHNSYLESYISNRKKSIYDPCPFGFRLSTNGTYNEFTLSSSWTLGDYTNGVNFNNKSWFISGGRLSGSHQEVGREGFYRNATICTQSSSYNLFFNPAPTIKSNYSYPKDYGLPVRCIDFFVSPLRPTDEEHCKKDPMPLQLVSKTVTLMVCYINGDVKIHLHFQQIAKSGEM